MNIQKQIDHWIEGSLSAIETADILIEKKKISHGLFFYHLAVEKILKAHYVKVNLNFAPKTHNLLYLAEHTSVNIDNKTEILLGELMKYQLEGRYPELLQPTPKYEDLKEFILKIKELTSWLTKQL